MDNVAPVPDVVGDVEPSLFKFWDAYDVGNSFLVEQTLNGSEFSLLIGVCNP